MQATGQKSTKLNRSVSSRLRREVSFLGKLKKKREETREEKEEYAKNTGGAEDADRESEVN